MCLKKRKRDPYMKQDKNKDQPWNDLHDEISWHAIITMHKNKKHESGE